MSGSDWTPVHHVHADEPEADPDQPPAKGAPVEQREGKGKPAGGESEEKGAPVGITLNLPPEFISAMWGYGDNVLRLAIAVEENTKTMKAMIGNDSNSGRNRDETVRKRPVARAAGRAAPSNSGVE